jgi:hypothetical protein
MVISPDEALPAAFRAFTRTAALGAPWDVYERAVLLVISPGLPGRGRPVPITTSSEERVVGAVHEGGRC